MATCVLVAGIRQSLCLEICTRPRGEERFGVTEGFPRTEFFLRRWKWLFRAVVGEMFFLSVGEPTFPFLLMIFVRLFTL